MVPPLLPPLCQGHSAEPSTQKLLPNQGGWSTKPLQDRAQATTQDSPFWQRDLLHMGLAARVGINLKIYTQPSPMDQANLA